MRQESKPVSPSSTGLQVHLASSPLATAHLPELMRSSYMTLPSMVDHIFTSEAWFPAAT